MSIKYFFVGITMVLAAIRMASAQTVVPPSAPSSAAAARPAAGGGTPTIQFQTTEFDFGKANSGEPVKHEFIFTNAGTATLEITEVKPGCGCTTAGTWDKLVEPGKTGVIPLQFNSTGYGGTVAKPTTVTCNDPRSPTIVLTLKGTLWKPIEVTPMSAFFNYSGDTQTNDTRVVRIVNNLEEPLTLSDVQSSNPSFRAELKTVTPGKEFDLHVTAMPPFSNRTTFATVTMKTSSPRSPTLNVTAYAMVQPSILVTPEQIQLPAGPLASSMNPSVTIRATGTNLLALSEASITLTGATVKITELQPGRLFTVAANFPAGFQVPPGQVGDVSIKSNDPKLPVIRVPVFQSQPPVIAKQVPATAGQTPVAPPAPAPTSSLRLVPGRSAPLPASGK